jgi:hypothetical protein
VGRLRRAGAIVLGKTNVSQLLIYHESDNPVYGRTDNPWDPDRTPGATAAGRRPSPRRKARPSVSGATTVEHSRTGPLQRPARTQADGRQAYPPRHTRRDLPRVRKPPSCNQDRWRAPSKNLPWPCGCWRRRAWGRSTPPSRRSHVQTGRTSRSRATRPGVHRRRFLPAHAGRETRGTGSLRGHAHARRRGRRVGASGRGKCHSYLPRYSERRRRGHLPARTRPRRTRAAHQRAAASRRVSQQGASGRRRVARAGRAKAHGPRRRQHEPENRCRLLEASRSAPAPAPASSPGWIPAVSTRSSARRTPSLPWPTTTASSCSAPQAIPSCTTCSGCRRGRSPRPG